MRAKIEDEEAMVQSHGSGGFTVLLGEQSIWCGTAQAAVELLVRHGAAPDQAAATVEKVGRVSRAAKEAAAGQHPS